MIFAREVSGPLTSLVKQLDAVTAKNQAADMGSFVVFCSDAEPLEKQLKQLGAKEQLKHLILSIDNPAGPTPYNVSKDADITVVLYNKSKVVANYTFKKGEFNDKAVEKILADVPKIVK